MRVLSAIMNLEFSLFRVAEAFAEVAAAPGSANMVHTITASTVLFIEILPLEIFVLGLGRHFNAQYHGSHFRAKSEKV